MGHSTHSLTSGPFCYCTQATKNMRMAKKYARVGARTHDRALISLCFDHWARKRLLFHMFCPPFSIYQTSHVANTELADKWTRSLSFPHFSSPLDPLLLSIDGAAHRFRLLPLPPPASPPPPTPSSLSRGMNPSSLSPSWLD